MPPPKILLIDDNLVQLKLTQFQLHGAGYEVVSCSNGKEALALAAQTRPDVVVSGVVMEPIDGFALCRLLRQTPGLNSTPVVLQSAYLHEDYDRRLATRAGASALVPCTPDIQPLIDALELALRSPVPVCCDVGADEIEAQSHLIEKIHQLLQSAHNEHAAVNRLKETTQALTQLTENLNEVFFIASLDGSRLMYISPAYERIWGRTCSSAFVTPYGWTEAVHPEDRDYVIRIVQNDSPKKSFSYRILRPDGEARWIKARCFPVKDAAGQPCAVAGIAEDVTEMHQAQEALGSSQEQMRQSQKLEAIGQLAGGVAHDFNNLLTAIMGYTHLILAGMATTDPRRDDVDEIRKTAVRAASLTRQLLAFSRRQILQPKTFELNALVIDLSKMLRRLIGEDIKLTMNQRSNAGLISADAGQIEQVLMNLAVNSRDAMPQGGHLMIETNDVMIETQIGNGPKPGEYVVLGVTDTGSGMDEETRSRIFEPFFTTKGLGKGTGLGLSTVYGIVAQSGGHIQVHSEIHVGTTFTIYLPKVSGIPESAARTRAPEKFSAGTETVLLVEDETSVRHLAARVLEQCGYRVLEAHDGETALALARNEPKTIHLLLTDVVMPGLDGRKVADELSRIHPESKQLFMSGYTDDAIVNHGILNAGIRFLPKPFSPEALSTKVREVLDCV